MSYISFNAIAPKVNRLLAHAEKMTLVRAEMVPEGFLFAFEGDGERVELHLHPTVYTQGKNIIDPINDMTLKLEGKLYRTADDPGEALGSVELAFSAWLGEDYL